MKIKVIKAGKISFNGIDIKEFVLGEIDVDETTGCQLIDKGWAEEVVDKPKKQRKAPVKKEEKLQDTE